MNDEYIYLNITRGLYSPLVLYRANRSRNTVGTWSLNRVIIDMFIMIIRFFVGTWSLNRVIIDRQTHSRNVACGHMSITRITWQEKGVMNGISFYQMYKIDMCNGLTVMFPDGREFYRLNDVCGSFTIQHLCAQDMYRGTWLCNGDEIALQWVVTGPRKNYTMISEYTRKK